MLYHLFMKQFLSLEERDKLKIQHRKERDKRICDRIKAVLLFDDGWNYQEIAHVLLLSDEAVKQHIPKQVEELVLDGSESSRNLTIKKWPIL